MDKKNFSIDEALKFGWNTMKANFWFFFGVFVIAFAVIYIPYVIGVLCARSAYGFSFIFHVASAVLSFIVNIGLIKIALKFVDGGKPEVKDLFDFHGCFWRYVGGSFLYGLIYRAGIILLVVPGIIWAIMFQYFGYCIVSEKISIMDALEKSRRLTKTVRWKLLGFGIVLALINYLGALVLLVGLFATVPTTIVAYAYVFRKLHEQTEAGVGTVAVEPKISIEDKGVIK